jgi:hypothetical protein
VSQPNLADEGEQPLVDESVVSPEPVVRPAPELPKQKQKTDVYTVMLIISFLCIVTASILLYWELTLWGSYPWWNPAANVAEYVPVHKIWTAGLV